MDATEFANICIMVAVILACIAWLAYATDRHDKKVAKLERDKMDYANLLADSIECAAEFRRAYWDKVRLDPKMRIGSEDGLFSATQDQIAREICSADIADGLIQSTVELAKRPSAAGE